MIRIRDGRVTQAGRGRQRGGVDDRDLVARGGRHPLRHGQQVPAGEDAGRPRIVDDVQDLRVREPGVDRHDRAACQLAGQVDEQGVGPVAQQRGGHRPVRSGLDLAQHIGQGRDPQPHLPVRVALRRGAEHLDGLAVRERPDVHGDEIGEGELHGCLRPASPGARGPGGARPPEARTVPGRTRATGMAEAACALHPCLGRMRLIDSDVGFNYCQ
jgi:hypothetical protein